MEGSGDEIPFEIEVEAAQQLLRDEPEMLLLDCREKDEWATASIRGARLIPMNELPNRLHEIESHRGKSLIVHCHHGGRSARVVKWLRQLGFRGARNMKGGIDAWSLRVDTSVPRY